MYGKNAAHYQDVTVRLKPTLSSTRASQKMIQQYDDNI